MARRKVKINWSIPAKLQLKDIVRHIRNDKPMAAADFAVMVRRKIGRLRQFPLSCPIFPDLPSDRIRRMVIGNYVAIYSYDAPDKLVTILAIRSCRQNFAAYHDELDKGS